MGLDIGAAEWTDLGRRDDSGTRPRWGKRPQRKGSLALRRCLVAEEGAEGSTPTRLLALRRRLPPLGPLGALLQGEVMSQKSTAAQVEQAGAFIAANLALWAGDHVVMRGVPEIQIDVNHYKPLTEEEIQRIARLGFHLLKDKSVSCSIRRLTFRVGSEPLVKSKTTAW